MFFSARPTAEVCHLSRCPQICIPRRVRRKGRNKVSTALFLCVYPSEGLRQQEPQGLLTPNQKAMLSPGGPQAPDGSAEGQEGGPRLSEAAVPVAAGEGKG